jgi:Domain of unknown function (DUF1851)
MDPTSMDLTKSFAPEQFEHALESWAWVDLDGKAPVFTSLFGDVFMESDHGWWYLDTIEGTLTCPWPTRDALITDLSTEKGEDRYLLGPLAVAANKQGKVLGEDQVYDFMPPPALGGGFNIDNIVVYDFVVAVNLAGQLHEQLRTMAPGAKITEFTLVDP